TRRRRPDSRPPRAPTPARSCASCSSSRPPRGSGAAPSNCTSFSTSPDETVAAARRSGGGGFLETTARRPDMAQVVAFADNLTMVADNGTAVITTDPQPLNGNDRATAHFLVESAFNINGIGSMAY